MKSPTFKMNCPVSQSVSHDPDCPVPFFCVEKYIYKVKEKEREREREHIFGGDPINQSATGGAKIAKIARKFEEKSFESNSTSVSSIMVTTRPMNTPGMISGKM